MRIIRKTNVFIKTERKFIVRQQSADGFVVCERCGEPMILAQMSVDLCGISSRVIYRLIDAGEIHFVETDENEIYVCPVSARQIAET